MPNRIIKESIRKSESIDELSWFEEVFFYRLITLCDDYGRYDARPKILKADLFPLKDGITLKQISDALNKLSTVGMVQVYEYDQKPYLQLIAWGQHQQIRNKRSKFPEPNKEINSLDTFDIKCNQSQSDVTVIQSESLSESKSKSNVLCVDTEVSALRKIDDFFERMWSLYPKKAGKAQIKNAKRKEIYKLGDEFERCIDRYLKHVKKEREQGFKNLKYQNGSTFFNSGYVDYLDVNYTQEDVETVNSTSNPFLELLQEELEKEGKQ